LLLGYAPFQCGEASPARAIEERPAEALYKLAADFRAKRELAAWETTLRFLMRNYPSSRFAVMADSDLVAAGLPSGLDAGAEPETSPDSAPATSAQSAPRP
jgi:hypothetical protein